MVKQGCLLLKELDTQRGNEFRLLHKPRYYFVQSMKVLWSNFYANLQARAISILKINFKKLRKKIWMFYIKECRDILVSLNIEILEKP